MKNVQITNTEVLSDHWYVLRKFTYRFQESGQWIERQREAYDRGNGAAILLYNRERATVILTRQFRLPTFVNGNETGMLIEACAGLLDKDNPEAAIRRETQEETGYKLGEVEKVFEAYMSPGSVTEMLYFFIAEYTPMMKVEAGGGLEHEEEEIEVLELPFARAWEMMEGGDIRDGKTIMLLQHVRLRGLL
ncbi:GDP-mannose pyrophosphatase NudK [Puia sp.]|jgi:nudix-type nucleoside diphosphatase (YffH/AdpP family)|uniref:GDP-mannose pyrophosphatase NudK n=1 Tax=Puia sp. TaxID=2045100 RepID=UPI002F4054A9